MHLCNTDHTWINRITANENRVAATIRWIHFWRILLVFLHVHFLEIFIKFSCLFKGQEFIKGVFFQKVRFVFQISQKNYSKKISWALNLKFPPISVNNLFKFQAHDSFWNNFFGRLRDLKNESHFLKKKNPPLKDNVIVSEPVPLSSTRNQALRASF